MYWTVWSIAPIRVWPLDCGVKAYGELYRATNFGFKFGGEVKLFWQMH